MARPLRLAFAGALYHVTARGNERRSIFLGDEDSDRAVFLDVLGATCERFNWVVHAYCLMTKHYHLLVETPDANLSKGMRQLNGVFTQYVNRTHGGPVICSRGGSTRFWFGVSRMTVSRAVKRDEDAAVTCETCPTGRSGRGASAEPRHRRAVSLEDRKKGTDHISRNSAGKRGADPEGSPEN